MERKSAWRVERPGGFMRFHLTAAVVALLCAGPASAEPQDDLFTGPDTILCLTPENLVVANQPAVAKSQTVLRSMGCLRPGSGVRTRPIDSTAVPTGNPLRVRFYPAGISSGIMLWALPSAFTAPISVQTSDPKRS